MDKVGNSAMTGSLKTAKRITPVAIPMKLKIGDTVVLSSEKPQKPKNFVGLSGVDGGERVIRFSLTVPELFEISELVTHNDTIFIGDDIERSIKDQRSLEVQRVQKRSRVLKLAREILDRTSGPLTDIILNSRKDENGESGLIIKSVDSNGVCRFVIENVLSVPDGGKRFSAFEEAYRIKPDSSVFQQKVNVSMFNLDKAGEIELFAKINSHQTGMQTSNVAMAEHAVILLKGTLGKDKGQLKKAMAYALVRETCCNTTAPLYGMVDALGVNCENAPISETSFIGHVANKFLQQSAGQKNSPFGRFLKSYKNETLVDDQIEMYLNCIKEISRPLRNYLYAIRDVLWTKDVMRNKSHYVYFSGVGTECMMSLFYEIDAYMKEEGIKASHGEFSKMLRLSTFLCDADEWRNRKAWESHPSCPSGKEVEDCPKLKNKKSNGWKNHPDFAKSMIDVKGSGEGGKIKDKVWDEIHDFLLKVENFNS